MGNKYSLGHNNVGHCPVDLPLSMIPLLGLLDLWLRYNPSPIQMQGGLRHYITITLLVTGVPFAPRAHVMLGQLTTPSIAVPSTLQLPGRGPLLV